jgi:hypothetical protein
LRPPRIREAKTPPKNAINAAKVHLDVVAAVAAVGPSQAKSFVLPRHRKMDPSNKHPRFLKMRPTIIYPSPTLPKHS